MKDPGDNITPFPSDPGSVEIAIDRRTIYRPACPHLKVVLRESRCRGYVERFVECRKCKQRLDPTEILWRYAGQDDRVRCEIAAWDELEAAWEWLWKNSGGITISRNGGVRGFIKVNGKKRTRKPHPAEGRGLPAQIVAMVEMLKQAKRWG